MKKNILLLLLMFMFMFTACETGTRYDKNTTKQTLPKDEPKSGVVARDEIEALLDDENEEKRDELYDDRVYIDEEEPSTIEPEVTVSSGLDVRKIREGKHDGYIRLVFDVYKNSQIAKEVGAYDAKYNSSKKDIAVILEGYQKFSAPLPSFPHYSVVEQIHFEQYPPNKGFKFHIRLRKDAEVKIFDLKSPARIVFDIKPI